MQFLVVLLVAAVARAFYLPGVAPTDYKESTKIPLFVNHLTPLDQGTKGEKTYVYSYDYYYPKFHFCLPEEGRIKQLELLGLILFGDRIFNSPFDIRMKKDEQCKQLCKSTYTGEDSRFVNRNIRAGYTHNWILDKLPVSTVRRSKAGEVYYQNGFPIGEFSQDEAHLYNHYDIVVEYHKRAEDQYRVVGALINPRSIARKAGDEDLCRQDAEPVVLDKKKDTEVLFTYLVQFKHSDTPWATRWDKYLHVEAPQIQWFSLVNFSLVVLILGIIIGHIFVRTLRLDIEKYNNVNLDDDIADETGWKLVHGDVFRPPQNRMMLLIFVGLGAQLLCMVTLTILILLFGLLLPANRGALSTFMLILFIFTLFISSYILGYLYRFWGGDNWKANMALTPLVVPGFIFACIIGLNFFLVAAHLSGAIPFGTMVAIVCIWFVISIPLLVVGLIMQLKRPLLLVPVRTNQIPRHIPVQPWYLKMGPNMLIGGLFPFALIFVELVFIYKLLWFNRIYYMFGFLFFCFLLMVILTALITVLMIYYTLCFEDYKWQWKALVIGGSPAVYVLVHLLVWMWLKNLLGLSLMLTSGYAVVLLMTVFLACGSVGFFTCLVFIRRMFSQIKVD